MIDFPKIISAAQTKAADAYTIDHLPIDSIDLMEKASMAFVEEFYKNIDVHSKIAIFCGFGNNGGDGFAIARLLSKNGYAVTPFLAEFNHQISDDCKINYDRLDKVIRINNEHNFPDFSKYDVIIDALFGSGLTRPIGGFVKKLIEKINASPLKVFSVDMPSGLFCDTIQENITAVKADLVISFQRPKMAFFFPEYGVFIKKWKVVDIGLDESFIQNQKSNYFVLNKGIANLVKTRDRYTHKGSYGHALLITGAFGKMGAAVLGAKACMKSGVGLLTTYIPKCGYQILQTTVPEAMCLVDVEQEYISELPSIEKYSAIGIGPGIGQNKSTQEALSRLLQMHKSPMVLDADALNILSENQELITLIPKASILTPHIKEFERLVGASLNALDRYQKLIDFAKTHQLIVVLKDAHTAIANTNGNLYFNITGNPGMATAGSGDVLTGIITGLLAQHYQPIEAAILGVYFHGKSGDTAAASNGEMGVIASDLIRFLKF